MDRAPLNVHRQMAALRAQYLKRLPDRIVEIDSAAEFLANNTPPANLAIAMAPLLDLAHNLAGSGATFGFPELGDSARKLEALCFSAIAHSAPLSKELQLQLSQALDDVIAAARKSPDIEYGQQYGPAPRRHSVRPSISDRKQIIIVEDNDDQRELLDLHLSQLGFDVLHLRIAADLEALLENSTPHLVITDIIFAGDQDEGLRTIRELRESGAVNCPVIFTTVRRDFEARLGAVRAGCDAYLVKPIDLAELSDLVLQITDDSRFEPFRILVIDDDPETAGYHALLLQDQGLITEIVNNPMEVMGPILNFRPDVILMDVNMPQCSGLELASVIRQHVAFVQLPIIFVTTETALDHQTLAMKAGGDEFVSKPINPEVLIPSVLSRAQRWRTLGSILARMRESESRFRTVAHSAPDGIVLAEDDGTIVFWNQSAQKMFGYEPMEIIGLPLSKLFPKRDREERNQYFNLLKTGRADGRVRETIEMTGLRKGGTEFSIEASIASWVSDERLYFMGIVRDASDRKLIEQQMREAKDAADAANLAKSDFLSSMSHELRTPMNSILGFGQLLQTNPEEPLSETQTECVDQVLNAGRHLLGLINEVLDLAKIEAGRLNVTLEKVSAAKVVKESIELIGSLASKRDISVELGCAESDIPPIVADYTRLRQVLLNVMSNAIKYNREHGTVTLMCRKNDDGFLSIGVTDTGNGIPEKLRDEVFRPFQRLGAEERGIEGTGIGLAITRQLVELMNGRIDFESSVGVGTTFWIDLPIAADTNLEADVKNNGDKSSLSGAGSLRNRDAQGSLLYIEDNPANLRLMEKIVGRVPGLTMMSAHTGELGVEIAEVKQPDVIIMDINLPGMDGFAALELLKANEQTKTIPVIALTANVMPKDIEKGRRAGFYTYLTKPIRIDEIVSTVSEALRSKRTL